MQKKKQESRDNSDKSLVKRIIDFGAIYIDYKMSFIGGLLMGTIVFFVNYTETQEITGSFTAATKQGGYTFLFGGSLMRWCEHLSITIDRRTLAIIASTVIPSFTTLLMTYIMHSLKGTPRPFESTLPTTMMIPTTTVWGYIKRRQFDKKIKLEKKSFA